MSYTPCRLLPSKPETQKPKNPKPPNPQNSKTQILRTQTPENPRASLSRMGYKTAGNRTKKFKIKDLLDNSVVWGWMSDSSDLFAAYADICFHLFGDRVKTWITLNEPQTFALQVKKTERHHLPLNPQVKKPELITLPPPRVLLCHC